MLRIAISFMRFTVINSRLALDDRKMPLRTDLALGGTFVKQLAACIFVTTDIKNADRCGKALKRGNHNVNN